MLHAKRYKLTCQEQYVLNALLYKSFRFSLPPFNLYFIYDLIFDQRECISVLYIWEHTGQKLEQVFEPASMIVFMSYCSNIARQYINVETCPTTCASFLPLCHQMLENIIVYDSNKI